MSNEARPCDLCQLPITGEPYVLHTSLGIKQFCCEGCQGIYRMLHEAEILEDSSKED